MQDKSSNINLNPINHKVNKRMSAQTLSIICPVYNEEVVVSLFMERILSILSRIEEQYGYQVDLIFSDNCSTDATLDKIHQIAQDYSNIYYISLAKNVGYQRSLHCALSKCTGDLIVIIDVDCEDPPEMILEFIEAYHKGYDVVYGERVDRADEPKYLQNMRKLFYRLTRLLADDEIILDMAEFSLMTREVRDAILREKNSFPFIRASIGRVGFKRLGIPYKRQKRIAGKTHYNFYRMTLFAVTGILSSTTMPLRLPMYALPFWLIAIIASGLWFGVTASSAALATLITLMGCYLGITVAFIAIYVARTYRNALDHPNWIVRHHLSRLPGEDRIKTEKFDTPLKEVI
jgi:dolichol-phosphate mannosyltransferase